VPGLVAREGRLLLQHDNPAPRRAQQELARGREADDSSAYNREIVHLLGSGEALKGSHRG
jgi:hypothetical protein